MPHLFWSSFPEGQHGFCHQKPVFLWAHLPCAHTILPPVFLCVYSRFSSFLSVGSALFSLSVFPPLNFMLHVLSLPSSQFWWIHSKEWGVFPLFPKFVIAQWMNSVSMIFPVELGQLGASYHFSRCWSKAFCGYFLFPICLLLTAARYTFLKHNFGHHRNFIICSGFGLKCNFSHTSECF